MPAVVTGKTLGCDVCHDLGWYTLDVPLGHPMFGKAQICACRKTSIVAELQALSGVAPSEMAVTLDDIDPEAGPGTAAMIAAAREFVQHPAGLLTISGSTGNGKSDTLHAVVNEVVKGRCVQAVYATVFDVMGWLREAFNDDRSVKSDSAYARLKRFEDVPVLCIDEFDKVNRKEWVLEQITDLVDHRHRFGLDGLLGTVIAMNAGVETMPSWIASRMLDGRNRYIVNSDPDMRLAMRR